MVSPDGEARSVVASPRPPPPPPAAGRTPSGRARAGVPDLNFEKGMRAEHCLRRDSRVPFTTSNYGIVTCPLDEWVLVVGEAAPGKDAAAAAAAAAGDGHSARKSAEERVRSAGKMEHGRRIPDIAALRELALVREEPKLVDAEIWAVVLYTGPMVP